MTVSMWYTKAADWVVLPSRVRSAPVLPTEYQMALVWNVAFFTALTWIVYRIYEIYRKPMSELVDVLGIDIPPAPDVSLAGITSNSALLYWKPPENCNAVLKHFIQVNGINVGDFKRSDASVTVTGLRPGCYYTIRAIATNSAGFSSLSPLIRLRTIPLSGHDQGKLLSTAAGRDTDEFPTHQSSREHSGSGNGNLSRRNISGRRISSTMGSSEYTNGHAQYSANSSEEGGAEETLPQLTRRLDHLRRQHDEIEMQIAEEEEESDRTKADLVKEREELKQVLKEKDEAQFEFKKQVNELEKHSKAAQRKKSAKERLLHQKQAEKQKMRDDVSRWDREVAEMHRDLEAMEIEKVNLHEVKEKKILDIRKTVDDTQTANKSMEEEIRLKGNQIKALEKERKDSGSGSNENDEEAERLEREKEQIHEARIQECQVQYTNLWKTLQMAEAENQQAQERLAYWNTRRLRDPSQFAPIPGLDFTLTNGNTQRRLRQGASRASTVSHSSSGYPGAFNSISSLSPSFSSASPFFNMKNGMTMPNTVEAYGMSQSEADGLTGGAPMSPTANLLLPSNLLQDDSLSNNPQSAISEEGADTSLHPHTIRGHGRSGVDVNYYGPQSPVSDKSRSPSLLSSPHDSLQNLHHLYPKSDSLLDSDQRSIHSANSPFAPAENNPIAARRLAGFFNFNRQRGKTTQEPPALGTLKQGQSQSFPRDLEQGDTEVVNSGRRRVSSGNWVNPMASLLTRSGTSASATDTSSAIRNGQGRKSRLHMFGSKLEPLAHASPYERTSSPRPASTYSIDNALPRPSTDHQPFGWTMIDSIRHRSSPLGVDWSSQGGPWSRSGSRRPSIQHGSSSNLSLGSTPLDPEDYQVGIGKPGSAPAPIGTERFTISQRSITPKLNPAAPSFTTRIFGTKKASRGEKLGEKVSEKSSKEKDKSKDFTESDIFNEDSSPPTSRLSRDARSITTTESIADSHDSLEQSTSTTPSDNLASSVPKGKDTLMQRLTRKGSSSKFLPFSKDGRSLFSKTSKSGEPSTPGELDEDDATSDYLFGKTGTADVVGSGTGTSGEEERKESGKEIKQKQSHERNRGSISWSNIMRKGKKGDKEKGGKGEKEGSENGAEEDTTGDETQ